MPRETHILRFKVISVECASLPNGQQYTIMYHRGSTSRSTPCYTAQGGVVNFATMPEGAAVVHFKSGHGGSRFAPKYIRFMIEEYTRGMPRRLIGETELDVTQVLKGYANSGSDVLTVVFRMYGSTAKMKVAVLAYPDHAPALTFDGLIDPADVAAPPPPSTIKVMNRGEAMMILMGLETLLERRRAMEASGKKPPQSREEKKIAELEERRKALVGSEGLATEVVNTRCKEVVAVQFTAMSRKYRTNFIGQTAAYLREMALQSGEEFSTDDTNAPDEATTQEQLARVNKSIDDANQQRQKLEEEQIALGRIQHKVDVTAELCANLDRVGALDTKLALLTQSRDALVAAVQQQAAKRDTELSREVKAIRARIAALKGEQQQVQPKIQHMVEVASAHVVKWARSKNPPEPEMSSPRSSVTSPPSAGAGRKTVDDLFSSAGQPTKSTEQQMLDDAQRKRVVEALKGMQVTAPPPTVHSPTSASSSSGHRTPRDIFANQPGLPSMGDFSSTVKKQKTTDDDAAKKQKAEAKASSAQQQPAPAAAAKPSVHEDPLKPAGLGMDMFSAPPPAATTNASTIASSNNPFASSDFGRPSFGGGGVAAAASSQPDTGAMFDFGAMSLANSASAQQQKQEDASPGFVLEPQRPDFSAAADPPAPPAVTVTPAYDKTKDPYYDEMDDFTLPAEQNDGNSYQAVEFTGGFGGFGNDSATLPTRTGGSNAATSSPAAGFSSGGPPARPTFDFGPTSGGGGGFEDSGNGPSSNSPAPAAFSFVGDGGFGEPSSTTNQRSNETDANNPYSGISNLPTYNFGG